MVIINEGEHGSSSLPWIKSSMYAPPPPVHVIIEWPSNIDANIICWLGEKWRLKY